MESPLHIASHQQRLEDEARENKVDIKYKSLLDRITLYSKEGAQRNNDNDVNSEEDGNDESEN